LQVLLQSLVAISNAVKEGMPKRAFTVVGCNRGDTCDVVLGAVRARDAGM